MRIRLIYLLFSFVLTYNILNAQETKAEKSGFFAGIHGGVSLLYGLLYNESGNKIAWNQNNMVGSSLEARGNIGIKLGWNTFFNQRLGIRAYFNYDYSDFRNIFNTSKIAFEDTSINVDMLLNLWNTNSLSIGMFIGFGIGYELPQWFDSNARIEFEKTHNYNGFILPINLGINLTLYTRHRIEFGTRIPTLATRYKNNSDLSGFGIRPYILSIGYIYIF